MFIGLDVHKVTISAAIAHVSRTGDAEPEAWKQTKALARQQHDGLVNRYLPGQPKVGGFLTEGLKKYWSMVSTEVGGGPLDRVTVEAGRSGNVTISNNWQR